MVQVCTLYEDKQASGMQGPPKSQLLLGNVHDSSMSKLNIHSVDSRTHFSPNQARITTYQCYVQLQLPAICMNRISQAHVIKLLMEK